jgi:hypothetical protein
MAGTAIAAGDEVIGGWLAQAPSVDSMAPNRTGRAANEKRGMRIFLGIA